MDFQLNIKKILSYSESRIFLVGICVMLLLIVWVSTSYWWLPGKTDVLITEVTMNFLIGRSAGMYFGLISGIDLPIIVTLNFLVDTIWVLILYPIVIFTLRNLMQMKVFRNAIDRIVKAAHANENRIRKYGIPGIFIFVVAPLPMTGPIVGGVIGYFIGLKPWLNVCVILSAAYTTIGIWAFFLPKIHYKIQTFSPHASLILLVMLVSAGLVVRLVHRHISKSSKIESID